jgi:hypothetical protein
MSNNDPFDEFENLMNSSLATDLSLEINSSIQPRNYQANYDSELTRLKQAIIGLQSQVDEANIDWKDILKLSSIAKG